MGRSYLIDRGIPAEAIIVEDAGETTAYSLSAASEILKRMGLRSAIVVSDGYHIFRVKQNPRSRKDLRCMVRRARQETAGGCGKAG